MQKYIASIVFIFVVSSLSIFYILLKLSPEDFPMLSPSLFFIMLSLASFSLFTLAGYAIRRLYEPKINKFISFNLSFRQGILLAIFTIMSALLLYLRAFTWWSELILMFILLAIEVYYVLNNK